MSEHVIITGTGRSGTTFLMKLFTALGVDTGFSLGKIDKSIDPVSHSGLDRNMVGLKKNGKRIPFLIKCPGFCDHSDKVLNDPGFLIKRIIIPFRDIREASKSRIFVHKIGIKKGALWGTSDICKQEMILFYKINKLLLSISKYSVPVVLINYKKMIKDSLYLYNKIKFLINDVDFVFFDKVFNSVVDVGLCHDYDVSMIMKSDYNLSFFQSLCR